jgi:hypothetical protein
LYNFITVTPIGIRGMCSHCSFLKTHCRLTTFFISRSTPNSSVPSPSPPRASSTLYLGPTDTSFYTRNDGWVVTSKEHTGSEHKIIWLPPPLRPYYPPLLMCISKHGFNRVDLSGCTFGEEWSSIFVGQK